MAIRFWRRSIEPPICKLQHFSKTLSQLGTDGAQDGCAATSLALACHSEEEEETVENVCLAVGQPSVSRQPQALSTQVQGELLTAQ